MMRTLKKRWKTLILVILSGFLINCGSIPSQARLPAVECPQIQKINGEKIVVICKYDDAVAPCYEQDRINYQGVYIDKNTFMAMLRNNLHYEACYLEAKAIIDSTRKK